jgi:acetolactate synthase-1/3 small subunit
LLLAKVSILGPEYVEAQLRGGHTYDPRTVLEHNADLDSSGSLMEQEVALAQKFEHSGEAGRFLPDDFDNRQTPLTQTQALLHKSQIYGAVTTLASQFGARVVDVSTNSIIIEMTGKPTRVDAFLELLKPFGRLESARTGA